MLADVEVARLDAVLRLGDRTIDDRVLDRLTLRHLQTLHDPGKPLAAEDAQQRIFERKVETRRAGIALAAGPAAQLIVDAARLVALGANDMQAAGGDDGLVANLPLRAQLADLQVLLGLRQRFVFADLEDERLDGTAEHDIGAAAGHVGRDGDHLRTTRLRDDLGLARVLLGVQHLVRKLLLLEMPRQHFGVLDRGRADEHRLPALVAILDVIDDGVDLFLERPEHEIVLVPANHREMRRNHHRFEVIDLLELERLGVRRAGHAGEPLIHPEVILKRDRRQRLVLALDRNAFLGFDRLVQSVGPAPAGHQPAGELVDDDDLAVLHHVVLVAVEERVRAQRRVEVMHQGDVVCVVEARSRQQKPGVGEDVFGVLMPRLGEQHLVRLFVDPVIPGALFLALPL